MRTWFSFNRSILFFCTLMVLLLLWLSVSFLVQAFSARQEAQFLSRYLHIDSVIKQSVSSIAQERSASHWLTGLEGMFSAENSLRNSYARSDESLLRLFDELYRTISDDKFSSQLTYQPDHIRAEIAALRKLTKELLLRRQVMIVDLDLALDRRNTRLQLSAFDFYGRLIDDLEQLREAFRYRPTRLSRDVDTGLMISNAAWNLNLSHNLLSALFEGYITSGKTALGTAYERTLNMQRSLDKHWEQLENIDAYNSVDQQLHAQAIELNDWFRESYFPQVKRMTRAIGETSPAPYTNWEWRKLALALEKHTVGIFDRADTVTDRRIEAIIQRTNRNLLIDMVLVLTCAGLMAGALEVGRRIHFQANHDDLTQLSNRRMFKHQCELVLDEAAAKQYRYVLIVLNLDQFKSVNDSLGQRSGDRLLRSIAIRVANAAGKDAVVARMGGDEFSVLKRYSDDQSAFSIVEKIASAVTDRFVINAKSLHITARIGYSLYPRDAHNLEGLRKAADLAIYNASQMGPGSIETFNPAIALAFKENQSLKTDLTRAIDKNEFELHYQPQVDLKRGVVDGVEALLRWNHPERGNVPPFRFIPVAEDAGLLPQIGRWVIKEAARQAVEWRDQAGLELRMSVNVSVHQFLHGDIAKIVRHTLESQFLNPRNFEIEITESVAMADIDRVLEKLQSLRQLGVRVALDDFGTGYSSLGYLQDLPLDTLKIDRSFITKLEEGAGNQLVLLESITHIAKSLDFHTVAEGVESDIQLHHVRALGIDTVQGYYFSKPLAAGQVPDTVEQINAMKTDIHKAA